ncbi:hypothetical protein EJB05_17576, partial [Eragrostis curvula]
MTMAAVSEKLQRSAGAGGRAASSACCSTRGAFRVLETAFVHPCPAPPETSLPLTFFNVLWLPIPPVQRVLFYRLPPDADAAAVFANLRAALSHAVRAFYPLAGRLRLTTGTANRYELHYRPGDAVAFTVAEYDHDLDSLAADETREVAAIAPPLPDDGGAVLALQATLLPARGLALGVTVHHVACDGAVSTHFLHTWAAAACRGAQEPPPPPVIDRTLISDTRGLYDIFGPGSGAESIAEDTGFVTAPDDKRLATFTLSRDHLQRVKDQASGGRRWRAPDRVHGDRRTGIVAEVDGIGTETMDRLMERIREAVAMGALTVAGSPRFRVYDLDMGFGRPVKVDIVSVAKTGAIAVAESRAGDGGMEVGVSLACGWHGQVPEVLC